MPSPLPNRRLRSLMGCAIVMLSLTACAPMGADDEDPGPSIPATPQASPTPESPSPSATPEPPAEPEFDRSARSIDDPASLWVVVNKARPLVPVDYVPGDLVSAAVPATNPPTLRAEAADALVAMFDAARAELGLTLQSQSAYRSYATQQSIFTDRLAREGRERTELFSARPGHSEHQTGLAVDIGLPSGECS
ncbi:MAG TPA: M15 family metallopeptidase, partial [Microcella sp.]|nr:M15 family metallopeptidase [Microcella sp.]